MTDLVEFILARLADDERVAREALIGDLPGRWETEHGGVRTAEVLDLPGYSQDGEKIPIARVLGTVGEFRAEMRNADHIARHDPARVLAEVDAKRRIVELHLSWAEDNSGPGASLAHRYCQTCSDDDTSWWTDKDPSEWPCPTLRLLALPYADHPEYRSEWKPVDDGSGQAIWAGGRDDHEG